MILLLNRCQWKHKECIELVVNRNDAGLTFSVGIRSTFLKQVSVSRPLAAHYNETVRLNRVNMFELWEAFGPSSMFYTVKPCDESLLKIRLYVFPEPSHE